MTKQKELTREMIDEVFALHNHQSQACLHLYRLAFPMWDAIKSLDGYPTVSEETNKYIFEKFFTLDKKYHPDIMTGGLWMNKGFSTYSPNNAIPDWVIDLSRVNVEYLSYGEIINS